MENGKLKMNRRMGCGVFCCCWI